MAKRKAADAAAEDPKEITKPTHMKRDDPRAKAIEGTPKFPKQQ